MALTVSVSSSESCFRYLEVEVLDPMVIPV